MFSEFDQEDISMSNNFFAYSLQLLTLIAVTIGCTNSSRTVDVGAPESDGLPSAHAGLVDMKDMFAYLDSTQTNIPKKPAEFGKYDTVSPVAGVLIPRGKIVYAGGKLNKLSPPKILGYEKDISETKRWVLLTNGEVKQVTEEEFSQLLPNSK